MRKPRYLCLTTMESGCDFGDYVKLKNIVIEDPRKRQSRTPKKDVNFYEL